MVNFSLIQLKLRCFSLSDFCHSLSVFFSLKFLKWFLSGFERGPDKKSLNSHSGDSGGEGDMGQRDL